MPVTCSHHPWRALWRWLFLGNCNAHRKLLVASDLLVAGQAHHTRVGCTDPHTRPYGGASGLHALVTLFLAGPSLSLIVKLLVLL